MLSKDAIKLLSLYKLYPKIFGGILADRENDSHLKDLNSMSARTIDLIVVNLFAYT